MLQQYRLQCLKEHDKINQKLEKEPFNYIRDFCKASELSERVFFCLFLFFCFFTCTAVRTYTSPGSNNAEITVVCWETAPKLFLYVNTNSNPFFGCPLYAKQSFKKRKGKLHKSVITNSNILPIIPQNLQTLNSINFSHRELRLTHTEHNAGFILEIY